MGREIERKFLVKGEFRRLAVSQYDILQRYLSIDPDKTIRLRLTGDTALLTIKGRPLPGSISRGEWEIPIAPSDAREIMEICLPGIIEKTRYIVPFDNHRFEVDVFHGKNEGLVIAELELTSEDEQFQRPEWLGEEVTGRPEYYNSSLIG
ncbi:MAG: CYTH domain-containing protein [Bacteroidales bacterium]|jgi:adenylate cyclase|nr:CYTH domain-containing protein [Bacteroidales bacterium]